MKALDVGRLTRSLDLDVEHVGGGRYRVSGGTDEHVVRADERPWQCDCRDAAYRPDVRCKHILGTYLHRQLVPAVRAALRSALGAT